MPKRNSTVKIVDSKVVLSQEVLNIIESWRTNENSIYIDEYLKIISNASNIDSKKSRGHHIIPVFLLKDETHKTRKEAEPLADKIEGNVIDLSISNHIKAHNFLRLIFPNNKDAKLAVYFACGKKNINNLTENEMEDVVKIIEDCSKENQTEDEEKEYNKIYNKKYYESHKQIIINHHKELYNKNKQKYAEKRKIYNNQKCIDPIKNNECTLSALQKRKRTNKELYKNINPRDCVIK